MATRRSARLKTKDEPHASSVLPDLAHPILSSDSSEYSSDADVDDDEVRPPRKRQKTARPTTKSTSEVKKRGGRLRMLAEMPVDVLLEIFSHLRPVDVLHLTWTSKDLRKLLMRRSATSVWRGAFDAIPDVPACPADQTLPQWARLLFVAHCHLCLAPSVTTVLFALRMRACQKCLSSREDIFVPEWEIYRSDINYTSGSLIGQIYGDNFPLASSRCKVKGGRWGTRYRKVYLRTDVQMIRRSCTSILGEGGQDALQDFLNEKGTQAGAVKTHAILCDQWYEQQRDGRSDELALMRSERRRGIIDKLNEIGYEADVRYILASYSCAREFNGHKLVCKNQNLTDKVWANIQQALVDFVLEFRPARLAVECKTAMIQRGTILKEVLAKYRAAPPAGIDIPPDGDIAYSEPFRVIWDVDPDAEVTSSDFDAALATIPGLYDTWCESVDSILLKCLDVSDLSVLGRATTWIFCGPCQTLLLWRDVRQHACPRTTGCMYSGDQLLLAFNSGLGAVPWNQRDALHKPSSAPTTSVSLCVEAMARTCALDTANVTPAAMDAAGVLFSCPACEGDDAFDVQARKPKEWVAAVRHHHAHHGFSDNPNTFPCIVKDEGSQADRGD